MDLKLRRYRLEFVNTPISLCEDTNTYIDFGPEFPKRIESFVKAFVLWGILDGLHQDDTTPQYVGERFQRGE